MYLGIDIGGTKIAGAVVTADGAVVSRLVRPTPAREGGAHVLAAALQIARDLLTPAVRAVGVGTGGQVDPARGVILSATDLLPGWAGTDVKSAFQDTLGLPACVDNDVNALAVGESRFGAARGRQTVVFLALGTGVGGALLTHGRVHHGAHGAGGEFGHLLLTMDGDARRDGGGHVGTLEAYASGPGLAQTRAEVGGDEAEAVRRTGESLGYGLVSLANALDPEVIVIGGGLAALGDALLDPARRVLRARALPGPAACPVVTATLGPDASVIGAASLAMPEGPPPGLPLRAGGGAGKAPLETSPFPKGEVASLGEPEGVLGPEGVLQMTLALVPLDERPVNTRYPQMLGAIGGARVLLPPPEVRGRQREGADASAVARWLAEAARGAQAALVSTDYLGYGNLIGARITQDSAAEVLARLAPLADLNVSCPVHAFSVITRAPASDDCVEEPLYWAEWGTRFARYGRLAHQAEHGELDLGERAELAALEASLPPDLRADWLTRRLRNHTVTLGLLDMAARGRLTSLLVTSDDTAPHGMPSRERDWLRGWPRLIGPALADRVMMHPGADEVGSALVARLLNQLSGVTPRVWPRVWVEWAVPGDEALVAPYEDRPVRETVWGQVAACGCVPAASPDDSDFILGVATPVPGRADYRPEYLAEDRVTRTVDYAQFLVQLAWWQGQGRPVALADVAYPNGADPLLTELLLSAECPLRAAALCAYGAWNTAGNTLGVVVAQAACSLYVGDHPERAEAQKTFLAHRFLEDWGYQGVVRREARADAEARWGRRDPDPDSPDEQAHVCGFIEARLRDVLTALHAHGIGTGLILAAGSVRLPWRRTFEVDFDLKAAR